ncbi:hypothetical protein A3843_18530 [Pseudovibrio exalbescens]|uniref:Uncharacterized protein n=1 Tax=Pseudovibrio exalbescens TaxID=197461 RepID=A0A1U7JD63_9HYPH|nr:hypothetical protein A3843_18530 [Pseudovibrio exalbescens]
MQYGYNKTKFIYLKLLLYTLIYKNRKYIGSTYDYTATLSPIKTDIGYYPIKRVIFCTLFLVISCQSTRAEIPRIYWKSDRKDSVKVKTTTEKGGTIFTTDQKTNCAARA